MASQVNSVKYLKKSKYSFFSVIPKNRIGSKTSKFISQDHFYLNTKTKQKHYKKKKKKKKTTGQYPS